MNAKVCICDRAFKGCEIYHELNILITIIQIYQIQHCTTNMPVPIVYTKNVKLNYTKIVIVFRKKILIAIVQTKVVPCTVADLTQFCDF